MISASQFDVVLSESAKAYLGSLSIKELEVLKVHLLAFYKTGKPPGSVVVPDDETKPYDRMWSVGRWEILYRFLPDDRRVEIGIIRPLKRSS